MFVISADQIDSRSTPDLVAAAKELINSDFAPQLTLPADRNAGDEIQVLTNDASAVLRIALLLLRSGQWSVGLGVGPVRQPLPAETREASGPAFNAARQAVTDAKKRATRFAVCVDNAISSGRDWSEALDAQSLVDMLLELRRKRSVQGWEMFDQLNVSGTQAAAAKALGISAAAASSRSIAASLTIERDATPSLVRLLEQLDVAQSPNAPSVDTGGNTAGNNSSAPVISVA